MGFMFYTYISASENRYIEVYGEKFSKFNNDILLFQNFLEKDFFQLIDCWYDYLYPSWLITNNNKKKKILALISLIFASGNEENINLFFNFLERNACKFLDTIGEFVYIDGFLRELFRIFESKNHLITFIKLFSKPENFSKFYENTRKVALKAHLSIFILSILLESNNVEDLFNCFTKEQIIKLYELVFDIKDRSEYVVSGVTVLLNYFFNEPDKMSEILEQLFKYVYKYEFDEFFFTVLNNNNYIKTLILRYLSKKNLKNLKNSIINISKSKNNYCQKAFMSIICLPSIKINILNYMTGGKNLLSIFDALEYNSDEIKNFLLLDYLDEKSISILKKKI